jgi:hypothetical protein
MDIKCPKGKKVTLRVTFCYTQNSKVYLNSLLDLVSGGPKIHMEQRTGPQPREPWPGGSVARGERGQGERGQGQNRQQFSPWPQIMANMGCDQGCDRKQKCDYFATIDVFTESCIGTE